MNGCNLLWMNFCYEQVKLVLNQLFEYITGIKCLPVAEALCVSSRVPGDNLLNNFHMAQVWGGEK